MSVDAHPRSSNIGLNCDAEGDRENWRIEEEEEERRREKKPRKNHFTMAVFRALDL